MSVILSIESSCDESAAAVFDSARGVEKSLIHSQIDLHAIYGGVVPDLASSEHLKKLPALGYSRGCLSARFLASSALEARADREGAMAAAGEQIYTGPVTHALSSASPSP